MKGLLVLVLFAVSPVFAQKGEVITVDVTSFSVPEGEKSRVTFQKGKVDDAGLNFWSNATATGEFSVKTAGDYTLVLIGKGNIADGVWPQAKVQIGNREPGVVNVDSPDYREIVVGKPVNLPAGKHKLTLSFGNDHSNPSKKEDRNLYVKKIELRR